MPLITAVSQAILLGDIPHIATILGGVFVIAGLFYTETGKQKIVKSNT
jgi:drug/metabolite transporter (DMT)-like permease